MIFAVIHLAVVVYMHQSQQFEAWKIRILSGHPEALEAVVEEIQNQILRMGSGLADRPNVTHLADISLAANVQSKRSLQRFSLAPMEPTDRVFYNGEFNSLRAELLASNLNLLDQGKPPAGILNDLNPPASAAELIEIAHDLVGLRIGSANHEQRQQGFIAIAISEASEAKLSAAVKPFRTSVDDDERNWAEQFELQRDCERPDG